MLGMTVLILRLLGDTQWNGLGSVDLATVGWNQGFSTAESHKLLNFEFDRDFSEKKQELMQMMWKTWPKPKTYVPGRASAELLAVDGAAWVALIIAWSLSEGLSNRAVKSVSRPLFWNWGMI